MTSVSWKDIFIGVTPCGLSYADRTREEDGDYKRLAFLPYKSLTLEFRSDCPESFRVLIRQDAEEMQARRGEQFEVSTSGQTITLGQ